MIHREELQNWIDPEKIAHYLSSIFGEEGLSWLDSDGNENGEWSIIGVNPKSVICCKGIRSSSSQKDNPFTQLKNIKEGFWIGWISFESAAWLEPKTSWHQNQISSLWIASYDPIIKFNLIEKKIIIEGSNKKKVLKYKNLLMKFKSQNIKSTKLEFDFSKINMDVISKTFQNNILKIKKLISKGDIFQINITTKCEINTIKKYKILNIYSKIRKNLRAPFGGIIINNSKFKREAVLSTSPERFLKLDNQRYVETRPIKGTRPRDTNKTIDNLNAIDLITNEKDRAENIMIVDLLRNDLGKVCEIGSIFVPELLKLESYLKVHHLTSVVRGRLKQNKTWVDLLSACWPGGSITGAPKLRSCQRIFELEDSERGPYCGSFLKIDWDGSFDSNILIRSYVVNEQKISTYAGCGIVSDSNAKNEYEELKWKLLPLINALK